MSAATGRSLDIVTLEINQHPAQLEAARGFVTRAAERFGLDTDRCFRLALAANEAVANAIEHGTPTAEGTIKLSAGHDYAKLLFSVRDGGPFIVRPSSYGQDADRGRGLPMMKSLADAVEIRSDVAGTLVTLAWYRDGRWRTDE